MMRWIHRIASMKIAVGLLIAIVVAMGTGTIIDAARGSETAGRIVYGSAWFRLLLAGFAVNVLASLVDRFPWNRQQIGFVTTHGAMLVILAGAMVTALFKVEGHLALWEGEESARVITQPEGAAGAGAVEPPGVEAAEPPGAEAAEPTVPDKGMMGGEIALPFTVKLESFEIDTYPGTQRPAMFRSRVLVRDPAHGREFPAVIQMNRELSYGGYKLFQSSYEIGKGRDRTVLAVSRDPGQRIVFAGYFMLLAGMFIVLMTRIAQHRAVARSGAAWAEGGARRAAAWAATIAAAGVLSFSSSRAAQVPDIATADALRRLPVQHDGRVMPLDTLAREAAWRVTGRARWNGTDPVQLALGWCFDPDGWAAERIVPVESRLASALGRAPDAGRASFLELVHDPRLMEMVTDAHREQEAGRPLGSPHKETLKLEERLLWMRGFLSRESLKALPASLDPGDEWTVPRDLREPADLAALLRAAPGSRFARTGAIDRELAYNRLRPSRLSWWILLVATLIALAAWIVPSRWLDATAIAALLAGFAVMTWGLAMRWSIAGRIPATNMYESLLFLAWGVGLFALIAFALLRSRLVIFNAAAMSALTMVLADCLPIDPFIHPVPPVLAGTAWLAIHVPIIMISYSVLALGMLVAHLQIGAGIVAPSRHDLAARLNDTLYWYLMVGSFLLIAGIITGSIWAASSWGRYWGWDPKEVWSLIAFLVYLAILHGRLDKLIGRFGVAAVSIVAFWTIVMTYVGVNFVLTSGLHSYGFGSSSVARWLMIVAAAEALFLLAGFLFQRAARGRRRETSFAPA